MMLLMMKGRHPWTCVALLLALSSVSALKKLKSIEDLKEINFGQSVPAHSLLLLHWFANTIIIDDNNRMRLTFYPSNGDYGSHHYGNYEGVLGPPPQGHWYYTIGNLNIESSVQLPDHVVNPPTSFHRGNRDRIIIRVFGERIEQVFITQHRGQAYDPDHTYQISPNLLRQIQEFPYNRNFPTLVDLRNRYGANIDVSTVRNSWGQLACLGLFLCIVMDRMVYYQGKNKNRGSSMKQSHEFNANRGSSGNNSSESWTDNLCLRVLVFVFILVVVLCAVNSPKMQIIFRKRRT